LNTLGGISSLERSGCLCFPIMDQLTSPFLPPFLPVNSFLHSPSPPYGWIPTDFYQGPDDSHALKCSLAAHNNCFTLTCPSIRHLSLFPVDFVVRIMDTEDRGIFCKL
jgi:hypothetical protein